MDNGHDGEHSQPQASPGKRLRVLIEAPEIAVLPGVYDCFSVKLVQELGFKAAFITGGGVSESRWGFPDIGLVGMAESLESARVLCRACDIPLQADADTGYGGVLNVRLSVQEFERAGAGGLLIEDQTWPKRCGHMAGKEVIPTEEMEGKVRSAVAARRDPDFVIKVRTDAAAPLGIDEAIERGRRYREAGADLVFPDALLTEHDIERFCREVEAPVAINMGFGIRRRVSTPLLSAKQLQDLGAAVVIYPRMLTSSAIAGMRRGMAAFLETVGTGKAVDRPDLAVSFEELGELMDLPGWRALEDLFTAPRVVAAPK